MSRFGPRCGGLAAAVGLLLASACAGAPGAPREPIAASRPAPPPRPLPLASATGPTADEPALLEATRLAPRFETRVLGPGPPAPGDGSWLGAAAASRAGSLVDLDLKDVDIANVCRLLADVGRVNIVVADDVHGSVTLRLRQVPWDRALDVILRTKGFRAAREADIIVVSAR